MKTPNELSKELVDQYKLNKNPRAILQDLTARVREIQEEFKNEDKIPENHEYWDLKSKLILTKRMIDEGVFEFADRAPETRKATYRQVKFGIYKGVKRGES